MSVEKIEGGNTLWGMAKAKLKEVQGQNAKITNQQIIDAMKAIAIANGQEDGDFDKLAKDKFNKIGETIEIPGFHIEHGKVEVLADEPPATEDPATTETAEDGVPAQEGTGATSETKGFSTGTVATIGASTFAAGVGAKVLYDKYGNAVGTHVKGKITKMGKAAEAKLDAAKTRYANMKQNVKNKYDVQKAKVKTTLQGAKEELKTNKFKGHQQATLEQEKANRKRAQKIIDKNLEKAKTEREATKALEGKKDPASIEAKHKHLANAEKAKNTVNNGKKYVKGSYQRSFKAGRVAVAGSKALGVAGRLGGAVAVAVEGYNVYDAASEGYKKEGTKGAIKSGGKQVVKSATALAGAAAGAKAGAAVGAVGGPIGAVAGGIVGGAIGWAVGSGAGKYVADATGKAFKAVKGWFSQ